MLELVRILVLSSSSSLHPPVFCSGPKSGTGVVEGAAYELKPSPLLSTSYRHILGRADGSAALGLISISHTSPAPLHSADLANSYHLQYNSYGRPSSRFPWLGRSAVCVCLVIRIGAGLHFRCRNRTPDGSTVCLAFMLQDPLSRPIPLSLGCMVHDRYQETNMS